MACNKTGQAPNVQPVSTSSNNSQPGISLQVTQSNLTLIQYNASNSILNLNWEVNGVAATPGTLYSLEYSLVEFDFAAAMIIDSTFDRSMSVSVEHLNRHMSEIIEAGMADMVKLRIRADAPSSKVPVYSNSIALTIKTYQNFTEYPSVIHVPGNYQNWNMGTAPHIISTANNGEYEGYVDLTNPNSEFLMVKGENWTATNTYQYIGANKLGFGGTMFAAREGAGIYRIRINTNTNTWEAARVKNWEIFGSALPDSLHTDHVLKFNPGTLSWTVTVPLVKGGFRIRANDGNTISFGHIHSKGYMVPDYKGDDFDIAEDGLYTITLNLNFAGNYSCSVIKRDLVHNPLQ